MNNIGNAVLRENDVMTIRILSDKMSLAGIAKLYGIGKSTVFDIIKGNTWAHIPLHKEIKGYDGYYILPDGRIYSKKSEKYLTPFYNRNGVKIELSSKNGRKNVNVADIVAATFLPKNKKKIVGFVDGDKYNTHFKNLKFL